MATTKDVPQFGFLSGLKVFCTGSVIAGPWGANLMAENGATVVQAESALGPDAARLLPFSANQDRRNELNIAFHIRTPEGEEIFWRFIKWADIWIESSKGGTYARWGLTDEVIWSHNSKLVIVHVSGFGQYGDPDYVPRPAYDFIGQAFGGYMFLNGMPEPNPPLRVSPFTCDYICALNVAWTALGAHMNAQRTGKGESLDIAQFETMMRVQNAAPMWYMNKGRLIKRSGNGDEIVAGSGAFRCKDGGYVMIGFGGSSHVFEVGLPLIGLGNDPDFPPGMRVTMNGTPAAAKLDKAIEKYCQEHTAEEVDKTFAELTIPCSIVMSIADAVEHPHYKARDVFIEWDDPDLGRVKGVNAQPRAKNYPNRIWRGAPLYGQDTVDLLQEFGYTQAQIDEYFEKGIIKADKRCLALHSQEVGSD